MPKNVKIGRGNKVKQSKLRVQSKKKNIQHRVKEEITTIFEAVKRDVLLEKGIE